MATNKIGDVAWFEWHGELVQGVITGLSEDTVHWMEMSEYDGTAQ